MKEELNLVRIWDKTFIKSDKVSLCMTLLGHKRTIFCDIWSNIGIYLRRIKNNMKKIISILIIGIIIIILIICFFKKERTDMNIENTNINNKSLVLYFSATNNTEQIAKYISEITSSDILEIIPIENKMIKMLGKKYQIN